MTSAQRVAELQRMSKHKMSLLDKAGLKAELRALGVGTGAGAGAGAASLDSLAKPVLLELLHRTVQGLP